MPEFAKKPTQTNEDKTQQPPLDQNPKPEEKEEAVSRAIEALVTAEPGLIEVAASAYVMRTDKGEKKLLGAPGSENGLTAKGEHQSAVQATAYGRAEAVKLGEQYALLVDAGIIVGGSVSLSGELEAKYGKLAAKLGGKVSLFGGFAAKASGRAQIGSNGLVLEGKADAFVGAKGKASAEATFDVGALGVGVEGEAEGKAGAWAEAEGEISFSKESIAVQGNVSAFAGVEGSVSGTGKARLYGRDAFTVKGGVTGQLGVGGEVGGGFKIKGGKIQLNVDAKGTLGIGGGGDVDITADLKPVAVWAWRQFDKVKWALRTDGKGDKLLDDPIQIVDPLATKIAKYSQEKLDGIHGKKAENFVKIEKLQAYVGEVCPRKQIKGRANAQQIDACIKEGIELGLGATLKGTNILATVTDGKITKLENVPEAEDLAARFSVKSTTGKALNQIVATD